MVRPKNKRKIGKIPDCNYFNNNSNTEDSKPIQLIVDEFEAIRLKDYHNIKQTESAELMGISQSTFHRILFSARKKMAIALIEGKDLIIIGDDFLTEKLMYSCNNCGFQWTNPKKEYIKCPDCNSHDIKKVKKDNSSLNIYKSFNTSNKGIYKDSNNSEHNFFKCPNCGYETSKKKGIQCNNIKCPKCETTLCGFDKN